MKIKKLFLLAVMPMMCLAANAQNADNTPKEGDFTVAATVGYNSYTEVSALSGYTYLQGYEAEALSTDWTTKKMMIGIEGGWFFKDLWKLNVGGGLSLTSNPGYTAVPGTGGGEATDIPDYRAVADAYSMNYSVFAGVDRYFDIGVRNLMVYAGARVGYAYSTSEKKWDDEETMGKSQAQAWNLRGALTAGADYYFLPAMYLGIQVDPVSYTYNRTMYKPQEGLGRLSADSNNVSVLAAPTIKVGFKF